MFCNTNIQCMFFLEGSKHFSSILHFQLILNSESIFFALCDSVEHIVHVYLSLIFPGYQLCLPI